IVHHKDFRKQSVNHDFSARMAPPAWVSACVQRLSQHFLPQGFHRPGSEVPLVGFGWFTPLDDGR
ncbi:MAG: hypothetical protein ABSF45_07550, partial [Terriglobia bacterium]